MTTNPDRLKGAVLGSGAAEIAQQEKQFYDNLNLDGKTADPEAFAQLPKKFQAADCKLVFCEVGSCGVFLLFTKT